MELFKSIVAVIGIIATIYFLIKKAETRTVLIGVGLIMSILTINVSAQIYLHKSVFLFA